jgi:hypothetical protein
MYSQRNSFDVDGNDFGTWVNVQEPVRQMLIQLNENVMKLKLKNQELESKVSEFICKEAEINEKFSHMTFQFQNMHNFVVNTLNQKADTVTLVEVDNKVTTVTNHVTRLAEYIRARSDDLKYIDTFSSRIDSLEDKVSKY